MRLLAVPATVVVVLTGLWVTGGAITDDFGVAMWLIAGWMALAGGLALAVAALSRV